MTDQPTDKALAAARKVLEQAALANAEKGSQNEAMLQLVASKEFKTVQEKLQSALVLDHANTDLSYTVSMFARIAAKYRPI